MTKILVFFGEKYEGLRKFFWPICKILFPRYIKIFGKKYLFMTANRITIGRTAMLVPFAFVYAWSQKLALIIFIVSVVFDFVDGLVAKIHKKEGHLDDGDLGAYLDAFLDKVFWVGTALIVLAFHDYQDYPTIINILIYLIPSILIFIEIVLGVIRTQDFYANKWQKKLEIFKKEKDLRAKASGKLKMFLESLGLAILILGHQTLAIIILIIAIPFGIKSIMEKINSKPPT
jgi:phosphatidylglycerophosphate synthase